MKKVYMLLICMTILLSLLFNNTEIVKANDIKSFTVIDSSDESYIFDLKVGNATTDMGDDAYVGQKLSNFIIMSRPILPNEFTYGTINWEEPDYVIVYGEQTVKIVYNDITNSKTVIFDVYIFGIYDNTDYIVNNYDFSEKIFDATIGCDINDVVPKMIFYNKNGKVVSGSFSYNNWNNMIEGIQEVEWVFTPDDPKYNNVSGKIKINVKPKKNNIVLENSSSPSLTATKIILTDKTTTFDINLNDKIEGSSYKWTSSNKKVAKVNSKGVVTPITRGKTTITCEITLPDYTKQVLTSEVIVGVDENTPVLSENDIEIEVGEKFTIKVENLIKGSKISWKSADKKIAKVSSGSGKVTGVKEGETYLICTITNGTEVVVLKCNVTVTK